MTEFVGSVWWLLVSLGILVTFHEFGHYWVARRCGVKVLRFSVGFGRALWSRTAKDGTEYRIAAVPLGGYVKMLDEREYDVPASQVHEAFNRASVWRRIAIVAAGPAANLLLCFGLLWAMFVIGRPDYAPAIGATTNIAAASGLKAGDIVESVGDRATPTWMELQMSLMPAALDREDVPLQVRDGQGRERTVSLALSDLAPGFDQRRILQTVGLTPATCWCRRSSAGSCPNPPPGACWPRATRSPPSTAARSGHSTRSGRRSRRWACAAAMRWSKSRAMASGWRSRSSPG